MLFEDYFNIVFPSTPVSFKWLLYFGYLNQTF